jgi:hypothetical protein
MFRHLNVPVSCLQGVLYCLDLLSVVVVLHLLSLLIVGENFAGRYRNVPNHFEVGTTFGDRPASGMNEYVVVHRVVVHCDKFESAFGC